MNSLWCTYPQIYDTSEKLLIDVSTVNVSSANFHAALSTIVPTTKRSNVSIAKDLSDIVFPLLGQQFEAVLNIVTYVFPVTWMSIFKALPGLKKRTKDGEIQRDNIKSVLNRNGTTHNDESLCDLHVGIVDLSFQSQDLSVQLDSAFFDMNNAKLVNSSSQDNIKGFKDPHMLPPVHRPRLLIAGLPGKS